jgi:tetratricopeptide (TPR) repeat protein
MVANGNQNLQNLIENFLEGLDEFNYDYFFPLDKILKEDIQERLTTKDKEFIEKYQKIFPFSLIDELDIEKSQTKKIPEESLSEELEGLLSPEPEEKPTEEIIEKEPSLEQMLEETEEKNLQVSPDIDITKTTGDLGLEGISDIDGTLETPELGLEETGYTQQPADLGLEGISDIGGTLETPELGLEETGYTQQPGDLGLEGISDIDGTLETPELGLEETGYTQQPGDLGLEGISDIGGTLETPELGLGETVETETTSPMSSDDLQTSSSLDLTSELKELPETSEDFQETPSIDFEKQEDPFSLDVGISESELKEMQEKSLLSEGIGEELTEKELAQLRQSLMSYSEPVRKTIIDAIVNEKISRTEQRILLNMLIEEAEESNILDFLEEKLGYRPKISIEKTKEGIPIIYTDDVSPEALKRKRTRTLFFLYGSLIIFLGMVFSLLTLKFYQFYKIKNLYEKGLDLLSNAQEVPLTEQEKLIIEAENYFNQALEQEGKYDIKYLNLYGNAYIKLGKFDKAFEKLFGKIEPDYIWNSPTQRVPLMNKISPWRNLSQIKQGIYTEFTSSDKIKRKLLIPGGYTVSRLRDEEFNKENIMNLAKFHSLNFPYFLNSEEGKKYKNDDLAIDYYKIILTLMNQPNDVDAMYGIGQIYYNQKKYSKATSEFQKIVDRFPDNIMGHNGIINTYIEIWKEDKDPRYVIAKHRYLQQLNLEKELPIYTLAKLAGFYIEINPEELRIRYNIDPVNTLNQLDINSTTENLLNLIFNKKENRDNTIIEGSKYGEGFYQRGRYYYKLKQFKNGVKQFQNAYYFDSKHYPSILYIGEYYLYQLKDFDKSKEYFFEALKNYHKNKDFYGLRPEDETLISFDQGLIYYDIVSVIFEKYKSEFIPSIASLNEPNEAYQNLLKEFISTEEYNLKALENLQDKNKINTTLYRQGFINYINANYDEAIKNWLKIQDDELYKTPNYYFALGNLSFKKEQFQQALGFFKQCENILENQKKLNENNKKILYYTFNNIGATYEAIYYQYKNKIPEYKLEELKQKTMNYYYKALEFGNQNNIIPVKAKVNLDLSFKRDFNQIQLEDSLLPDLFLTNKDFQ